MLRLVGDYLLNIFAFDPNSPLLFTQFRFWAFLAVVFVGFAIVAGSFKKTRGPRLADWHRVMRNGYLFLISLLFYYKTSGLFVGLLILVTCTDYLIAQGIYHVRWAKKANDGKLPPEPQKRKGGGGAADAPNADSDDNALQLDDKEF